VLISERNQRTKTVKGKKGLLALSASLSINPVRKADTRLEESKTSATDRVIGLIIPTGSGAAAVIAGETICETDCLLVLGDDPSTVGFLRIVTISKQTTMLIRVIKDKEGQLPGRNHPLQWQRSRPLRRLSIITS
jgi:hypothetical protein